MALVVPATEAQPPEDHSDGVAASGRVASATDTNTHGVDWRAMAARIDQLLELRLEQEGVEPFPLADDAEFLRRVTLDLAGIVPTAQEAREFLASDAADKREQWIERLLRSPRHASQLAITWRNRMLPDGFDPQELGSALGLEDWLRRQFASNLRYDNLVADLIASTGSERTGPALYFTSLELKPEKLAASTARLFLGLQIQCAECHKHPFDRWTQEDFWGYAAFFAQLRRPEGGVVDASGLDLIDSDSGEVRLPDSETVVAPRYPGGAAAEGGLGGARRRQLAIWLAARDNPYLSRAAANWAWAHLFGRGIVDPVDDLSDRNPPSHPELLDELAEFFERSGFDLRMLLRVLANTRAYQRTSQGGDMDLAPELFARMTIKTMTPDQFYDSLVRCLAQGDTQEMMLAPGRSIDARRLEFVTRMQGATRSPTEYEGGPPQALLLMNGPLVGEATSIERGALLRALEAPFFDDDERLETLLLATLTRQPTDEERSTLGGHLRRAVDGEQRRRALSDILWAVLNSAEFALNH